MASHTLHDLCTFRGAAEGRTAGVSRERQKTREFATDLAESIIIDQTSVGCTDTRRIRCTARYFRISLLADVYYLFAASNPFDIPRRRINKSADHRQAGFLAKLLILIIPLSPPADIVHGIIRMNGARYTARLCSPRFVRGPRPSQRRLCPIFISRHRFRERL